MSQRQYNFDPNDRTLLVTQAGREPFTLDERDAGVIDRMLRVKREQVGMPLIDKRDEEVTLTRGMTTLVIGRAEWDEFKAQVNAIDFPKLDVPGQVEVELSIQANHTVTLEASDLLDGDYRFDSDDMTWAGTKDELDDAMVDAVHSWDWYGEMEDMLSGFDYVDQVDAELQ
jgi:hypothetical protein